MNLMRYLNGSIHFNYANWQSWNHLSANKYWGGRLLYLNISKFSFQLDCRKNWVEDMINGRAE